MKKSLKYILILACSIFLIGCMSQKNTTDSPEKFNEESKEKSDKEESNEKFSPESESGKKNKEEYSGEFSENVGENKVADSNKKKVIYLTFDDGPSYDVTENVLDILKQKDIKATFFLIGNQIKDKEDVVRKIHNDGNSIGLHSYTHNYKKLYGNETNFVKEMIDCRDEIRRVVGISPNIIRFPGGSYKRLNKSLLKKLHDNNFKVYDWNVENCDGLKPKTSPDELYEKAIKGSEDKENIILLLHCTSSNNNTCLALPRIIEYYKSHDYEFRIIKEDTKELYAPIKKK